jgi:hypothetical protein
MVAARRTDETVFEKRGVIPNSIYFFDEGNQISCEGQNVKFSLALATMVVCSSLAKTPKRGVR